MNEAIRSQFRITQKLTYLNSAAVSPMPAAAIEAIHSQLQDVAAAGSTNYPNWVATKNRARSLTAEMLCVRPDQIAFMRNTSDGLASVANGLPWQKGDNVVSFANEFPANFYPWRRIRDEFGVELRLCPERGGRMETDELLALIDSNTRVVTLSSVQFASGYTADLERIGRMARAVDGLFCVDIIQGFGAAPYDLPAQFVDAASGASHKWLCGPEGCGLLYLSDRARERVKPTFVGWISVETPWNFDDREQPFRPTALAWESGTGASSLFYGLEQSLKLLNETGIANVARHLEILTDHLCDSLAGKNYEIVSSRAPGERSHIVCIRHRNGLTPNEIFEHLQNEKIIVSARGDRIRIAPHFYNVIDEIDRLVVALPD